MTPAFAVYKCPTCGMEKMVRVNPTSKLFRCVACGCTMSETKLMKATEKKRKGN